MQGNKKGEREQSRQGYKCKNTNINQNKASSTNGNRAHRQRKRGLTIEMLGDTM